MTIRVPLVAALAAILASCSDESSDPCQFAPWSHTCIASHIPRPSNLAYPDNPATYRVGQAIQPNVPTYSGSASGFTVSPPLPQGLTMDEHSGIISGTPAEVSPLTYYRVWASHFYFGPTTAVDLGITVIPP